MKVMKVFSVAFACLISSSLIVSTASAQLIDEAALLDLERKIFVVETRIIENMPFLPSAAEAAIYVDISQCMILAYKLDLQEYTYELNEDMFSSIDLVYRGLPISHLEDTIIDAYQIAVWWSVLSFQLSSIAEIDQKVAEATWDLNCAGRAFISKLPPYERILIDASSRIQRGTRDAFAKLEGQKITVLGEITDGFSDNLKDVFLNISNPSEFVISLGSGGGNVGEAVRGRIVDDIMTTLKP